MLRIVLLRAGSTLGKGKACWKYFGQREGMLEVLWAKGRPLLLPGHPSAGSTLGKGKALAGHLYSHTLPLCSVQLKHSEDYDTVSAWWVIFIFYNDNPPNFDMDYSIFKV